VLVKYQLKGGDAMVFKAKERGISPEEECPSINPNPKEGELYG
jgi:hypothetical protein